MKDDSLGDAVFALLELTAKAIIGLGAFAAKSVILLGGGLLLAVTAVHNMVFGQDNKE